MYSISYRDNDSKLRVYTCEEWFDATELAHILSKHSHSVIATRVRDGKIMLAYDSTFLD
jgi:hypothetical protein